MGRRPTASSRCGSSNSSSRCGSSSSSTAGASNTVSSSGAGTRTSTAATELLRVLTRHATGHTTSTTSLLVHLGHDGVDNSLNLLLLAFVDALLLHIIGGIHPGNGLVDDLGDLLLVSSVQLATDVVVVEGVADVKDVAFQSVLGLNLALVGLVLSLVLLSLSNHALDIVLGETALVVGDGDAVLLGSALVLSRDVEDTVGINIESDLDLRNTTRSGGNARELELAEGVVVLGHGALTLEHLDQDTGLVVRVGGEGLGLLGGDGGVAGDEGSHHTSSGLETQSERGHIEKKEIVELLVALSLQDGGLDSGTIGNSLIGVDGFGGLLAVEEVLEELLDLGDTGGSSDQDNLVHRSLVDLGVTENLLDGLEAATEQVLAQVLEQSTSDGGVEINTLEESINLNGSGSAGGKSALSTLAGGAETTEGARVAAHVHALVLALELLHKVVDHAGVKVLTTQVSVTSGGLDLEDTVLNG